jgi:CheY-like chemotaxis protein
LALVVEDNEEFRKLILIFLKQTGLEILSYSDPVEALEGLKAASAKLDLLVTDFDLPHLNGSQLAEAVARLFPGLPMILVTGAMQPEGSLMPAKQRKLFNAILSKPVEKAQLIDAVVDALTRSKKKKKT